MAHLIKVTEESKAGNVYVTPKTKLVGTAFIERVISQNSKGLILPDRGVNERVVTETAAVVSDLINTQAINAQSVPLTVKFEIGFEDVNYADVSLNFDPARVVEVFQYASGEVYIEYAQSRFGRKYYIVDGTFAAVEAALVYGDFTGAVIADQIEVKAVYDFAVDAGAIGTIVSAAIVPEGYVVKRAYYEVLTTFTSATDAGTFEISGAAIGDIVAATAISAVGDIFDAGTQEGIQDGTVALFSAEALVDETVDFVIAIEAITAGKLAVTLECVRLK